MMNDGSEAYPPPGRVATSAERRAAGGEWLLAAAPAIPQAKTEWQDSGAAWLRPGRLFAAVAVNTGLVHTVLGVPGPEKAVKYLGETLDGPVFYREQVVRYESGYTALLPSSVAQNWRVPSTVVHPSRALLLVPAPDRCEPVDGEPWWAVPLDGPGQLCTPRLLALLVAAGWSRLTSMGGEPDA
ncbi:hypothetical protein ACIQNG_25350 [Streptomyces sp. NPDC091377]|uniref:hypothetical protein n=1 Tax=Streptomyces sp. NPDC091377 TaxID=3365995 RepID=UPI0038053082